MLFSSQSLLRPSAALFVVAMASSSFWPPSSSNNVFVVVDAQVAFDRTVVCHPDAPTVCVGETTKSIQPSPNGDYTYWAWNFVKPGEAEIDPAEPWQLEVVVSIDEVLGECEVTVNSDGTNSEPCNGCSLIGCDDGNFPAVKYDCRNIEATTATTKTLTGVGDFGECYPVEDPFVYPFELPEGEADGGNAGGGGAISVVVEGAEDSSSSDDPDEEESSFIEEVLDSITGSSAHSVVAAANGVPVMAPVVLVGTLLLGL